MRRAFISSAGTCAGITKIYRVLDGYAMIRERMKITVLARACDLSEVAAYCDFARRGHLVHVIYNSGWQPDGAFDDVSVTSEVFDVKHRFDFSAVRSLSARFRKDPPDLIYAPNNRTLAVALMATRSLATKVVGYRGTVGHIRHYDPASLVTYLHPRLAGIVCLSKAVEEYLVNMRIKAKMLTAYKGFDVEWYKSDVAADLSEFEFPENAFIIGFTGNIRPVKGIDMLLKALVQLPSNSKIRVLLVGEVRCKRVKRMLRNPIYSARVHLAGFRSDACQLMGGCNAFVMPSINREGLCRAVVEAMAQSVPPIVSDAGGMPELVEASVSGVVVPPSDPEALSKALYDMEQDVDGCRRMGAAAELRIKKHFTIARTTDCMEELFRSVIDE